MVTRSLMKLSQTMLLSLLAAISLTTHAAVNVGQPAPDFTGLDSNGKQHSLSQYKGKTVILEWTVSHRCSCLPGPP